MNIIIVHMQRSAKIVNGTQLFNLSRRSEDKLLKALSNDFTHLPLHRTQAIHKVDTVAQAVEHYNTDLIKRVKQGSRKKILVLRHLYNKCVELTKQNKDIYFGCWCMDELKPKPYDHICHCQPLRNIMINKWNKDEENNPALMTKTEVIHISSDRPRISLDGLKD